MTAPGNRIPGDKAGGHFINSIQPRAGVTSVARPSIQMGFTFIIVTNALRGRIDAFIN